MENCIEKQKELEAYIAGCNTPEDLYRFLIGIGKKLPKLELSRKTKENVVNGCQGVVYLSVDIQDSVLDIGAEADGLISGGLVGMLRQMYNCTDPQSVMGHPPIFLKKQRFFELLSSSRIGGFASLYKTLVNKTLIAIGENGYAIGPNALPPSR